MVHVSIRDVTVDFPFSPYAVQERYMEAVVDALNGRCNALLESPTGTGKTMCLLCATLAWVAQRRSTMKPRLVGSGMSSTGAGGGIGNQPKPLRIVYTSRTHTQLSQVIREFKRTAYAPEFSMALLGSREYMCVNTQVLRLPTSQAQNMLCNSLRADRNCRYFRNLQTKTASIVPDGDEKYWVHDMEDLVREGRKQVVCPYFYERDMVKDADIVFLPYNYVLDHTLKRQLPFDLTECILIIDEAHNLPGVLSASGTMNLSPLDVSTAVHECTRAMVIQRALLDGDVIGGSGGGGSGKRENIVSEEALASLKIVLVRLEECISAENDDDVSNSEKSRAVSTFGKKEIVRRGSYIVEFLAKALITRDLMDGDNYGRGGGGGGGLNEVMSSTITMLTQNEATATGIAKVQQLLNYVFDRVADIPKELLDEGSRFIIQEQGETEKAGSSSSNAGKKGDAGHGGAFARQNGPRRTLGFWCLDTSSSLCSIAEGQHSLILTSGTLSPLDHFAAELGISFPVQLQNAHVVESSQVLASILCKAPGGERLNGGFAFRGSVEYRLGLGMGLVNMARLVPGGMIVFFPSYTSMNAALDLWRTGIGAEAGATTVWGLLSQTKPLFIEPMDGGELQAVVSGFQRAVSEGPAYGAVLFAVCRGKISEGVDFSDRHGRCVVVTGIPFANHTDLLVRLKREYFTDVAPKRPLIAGKPFTGDDWYRNEAMRAVNQSVGRVIRHKDDYGAVILADERFGGMQASLSEWVSRSLTVHKDFRESYSAVAAFFQRFREAPRSRAGEQHSYDYSPSGGNTEHGDHAHTSEADVPDSAALAEKYAEQQEKLDALKAAANVREHAHREHADVPQSAQQRNLPFAVPVQPNAHVTVPTEEVKVGGADLRTNAGNARETKSKLPSRDVTYVDLSTDFQKQVVASLTSTDPQESVPSSKETSTSAEEISFSDRLLTSTSKEYCSLLKSRLSVDQYNVFRTNLQKIAALRTNATVDDLAKVKTVFGNSVSELKALFSTLGVECAGAALQGFGRHIPADLQLYYNHLLRKRNRSPK